MIESKIAKALLRQRDPGRRLRMMLTYAVMTLLLLGVHAFVSNSMESPVKVIPQTMAAVGMGYLMLYIISLRHFRHVSGFIDWTKVEEAAEAGGS